ncbi:MAG: MBL fold metallo-hydrolase, partial [Planctomycetes bacterium]|nr:MBL fold metallo-hydrolase [Planctomycetota bacterium]
MPPDHREQSLRVKLDRCDAILLTHAHVDHVFGLDEVRRYNAIMRRAIPVYGDAPTWEQLERVYQHILFREHNVNASFVADLSPHRVRHGDVVDLHGLRATAFTLWHGKLPILGVCLGHQSIGAAFGGKIIRAQELMHGKTSIIQTKQVGVFKNLPEKFTVNRYHSLAIERSTCPADLEVTAWTEDGEIMGVRHKHMAIEGVQFHPESILTEHGHA